MTKNDIRLRKQGMSTGRIRGHRNFAHLMQRHSRTNRLRKSLQVIIYIVLMGLIFAVIYYSVV